MLPSTRKEAKETNSLYYFTNKKCKHGHIDKRRTGTGACVECARISSREKGKIWRERNKEKRKKTNREWYLKNRVLTPRPPAEVSLENRFLKYHQPTNKDKCWEWFGSKQPNGYGQLSFCKNSRVKVHYAHRLSYEHYRGPVPEGYHVCHHCDNPSCVNPHHLFLGTDADNHTDKVSKDRQVKGEQHGGSKYSEDFIQMLKYSTRSGYSLGKEYNIDPSYIYGIRKGKYWKHI